MTATVLIVTHDYYAGESLAESIRTEFGGTVAVTTAYRPYNIPELQRGDIVVSDGSCKERDDDGVSCPIPFDAKPLAEKAGAAHILFPPKRKLFDRLFPRQRAEQHEADVAAVLKAVRSRLG